MSGVKHFAFGAFAIVATASSAAAQVDLRGTLRAELYAFDQGPLSTVQTQGANRAELDLAGKFELTETLSLSFDVTAGVGEYEFGRIDRLSADFDIGSSTVSVGYNTLRWSRSEFAQLSNVVNPRDYRFDPSGQTTIGQPMLRWDLPLGPGVLTTVAIPRPLDSEFPSAASRLRGIVPVTGDAITEKSADTSAYALRYAASIGAVDVGFYGYVGPSREAALVASGLQAAPYYAWVEQVGIDAQVTFGSAVGKFELRHTTNQLDRTGQRSDGLAASIGGEYTFYGVFGSAGNVTAAFEYASDERGLDAWATNQKDLYAGVRWSLQNIGDTRFEIGFQKDLDFDTSALRLGFEHRIADGLVVKSDALIWQETDQDDLAYGLSNDSHIRLIVEKSF